MEVLSVPVEPSLEEDQLLLLLRSTRRFPFLARFSFFLPSFFLASLLPRLLMSFFFRLPQVLFPQLVNLLEKFPRIISMVAKQSVVVSPVLRQFCDCTDLLGCPHPLAQCLQFLEIKQVRVLQAEGIKF